MSLGTKESFSNAPWNFHAPLNFKSMFDYNNSSRFKYSPEQFEWYL